MDEPSGQFQEQHEDFQSDMGSNSETNSEAESISEEERVKRLFAVCDTDGDGYIDSQDLAAALQELGLDGSIDVPELMQQMGADSTQGKVSYQQFLQCRLSHKTEIEALKVQSHTPGNPSMDGWATAKDFCSSTGTEGMLPTSSEHSLGVASGKHESWEFDSGARDLSPEPSTLYKLIEAAGLSPLSSHPAQVLDVANKLHLAALSALRGEISELHGRLQRAAQDRDTLEQALAKTQLERLRLVQESEERLERQSNQYEERLTELHSVIAELTRKLNRQHYNVIKEEGEEEEDEIGEEEEVEEDGEEEEEDGQRGADNNNTEQLIAYSRLEGQDPPAGAEDKQAKPSSGMPRDPGHLDRSSSGGSSSDLSFGGSSSDDDEPAQERRGQQPAKDGEDDLDAKAVQAGENLLDQFLAAKETTAGKKSSSDSSQLAALTAENRELKTQTRRLCQEADQVRAALNALKGERDELKRQLETTNSILCQQQRPLPLSAAASLGALSSSVTGSPVHQGRLAAGQQPVGGMGGGGAGSSRVSSPVVVEEGPICKMAERVRIKRLEGHGGRDPMPTNKLLTGSQIASLGVRDARVAEQLVSSVQQDSVAGEAQAAAAAASRSGSDGGGAGDAQAVRLGELEMEVERLASRSEHLRAQNDVLSLTLAESRALGERMAVLLGKYESNCMALRLALERADRVSEAYEVLAALVESEMSLLLANCQVAGLGLAGRIGNMWDASSSSASSLETGGGGKDFSVLWKRANERRRSSENLARCLLARYGDQRPGDHWTEDSGRHTNTTSSTSSGAESGSGSGSNPAGTLEPTERKVRDIISRLKADRASLESTIQQVTLPLESALVDPLPREVLPLAEARKMDLEMAVIMQELMAMREERSRLRTQVYILEKERAIQEAAAQHRQLRALEPSATGSSPLPAAADDDPGTSATAAATAAAMASVKEKQLQLRVQELTGTLERVIQSAELRGQQSAELVSDVKKANATLVQLLERNKKKYATRLRRLEQQMVNMSERHAMQVRVLKQRILSLEEEDPAGSRPLPLCSAPSETSL